MFFRSNQIAIVGNGWVNPRLARAIDRSKLVVRFNLAHNYGLSGRRTNILVLANTGWPAQQMVERPSIIPMGAQFDAKHFWFARAKDLIAERVKSDPAGWMDFSDDLIRYVVNKRPVRFLERATYVECERTLNISDPLQPSAGFLAIHELRKLFPNTPLALFGFSHQGADCHAWDKEREAISAMPLIRRFDN